MTIYHARVRVSETKPEHDTRAPRIATAEVWPDGRTDRRRARTGLGWTHGDASTRAVEAAFAALDEPAPGKPGS